MKIYLDGGSLADISLFSKNNKISGFTTNPSLLKSSSIINYKNFVYNCSKITNKPISFEVTADNYDTMLKQSEWLSKHFKNSYIKIPILNTKGQYNTKIIQKLTSLKYNLNITAVFTKNHNEIIHKLESVNTTIILLVYLGKSRTNLK